MANFLSFPHISSESHIIPRRNTYIHLNENHKSTQQLQTVNTLKRSKSFNLSEREQKPNKRKQTNDYSLSGKCVYFNALSIG